jgi:hypothetical protein
VTRQARERLARRLTWAFVPRVVVGGVAESVATWWLIAGW